MSAEDILWRRTKLGLELTPAAQANLESYLQAPHGVQALGAQP